jgi:hypothetical protein
VPVVEIEHHRIGSLFAPASRRTNLRGADHGVALIASARPRR